MKRIACLIVGLFSTYCAISGLPQLWQTFHDVDISSTYGQTKIIAGIAALLTFAAIGASGLQAAFRKPKSSHTAPGDDGKNQPPAA